MASSALANILGTRRSAGCEVRPSWFRGKSSAQTHFAGTGAKRTHYGEDRRQIMYSNYTKSSLLAGGDLHLGGSALVAEELGVHALGVDVSLTLGLLDAVSVLL